MEVDESLIANTECNNMQPMEDTENTNNHLAQNMETGLSHHQPSNENLSLAPSTHENIVANSEQSVISSPDHLNEANASAHQITEVIKESTENNNRETTVEPDSQNEECMEEDKSDQAALNVSNLQSTRNYLRSGMSSPESSEHSEFDLSDEKHDFEIWTSDSSSPDVSDDPENVEDEEQKVALDSKQKKKVVLGDWNDIQQEKIQKFEFTGNLQPDCQEKLTPLQCFNLFVNDDVINLLVSETNKFARSKFVKPGYHRDFLTGWIDVTPHEMRQLIGLLIFMTFRRLPGTKYYWSGDSDFSNPVAGRVMTATRFKRLLTFWHFGDDKVEDYSKIKNLLNLLNVNFSKHREPESVMYVGKATLFLRDKYAFQRGLIGIPKIGQRLLRLLDSEIYAYKVVIMPPDNSDDRISQTKQLVLNLLQDYLNKGRLVVFHNLFLSLDLAQELLKNKTHVVGPLRKKARNTPVDFRKLKVKNNELKGFQNSEGISILKWRSWGQPCYGLSTCHGTETVQVEKVNKRDGKTIVKQQHKFLRDFDLSDKVFDLAEKFSVTESPLNNETKWFRRLANDLLTGTCVSNAFCLYKKVNNEKLKFYVFQDRLWRELVGYKSAEKASFQDSSDEEG